MTDSLDATIERLGAAGLLNEFPALKALHDERTEAARVESDRAAALESERALANLQLEEQRKATEPLDLTLPRTPHDRTSRLAIAPRDLTAIGVVTIGASPRPRRVMMGRMGWLTVTEHTAVAGFLARHAIRVAAPDTPHHDLDALLRSAGYGPELDGPNMYGFLQELFAGASGSEMSSLIARWYLTARDAKQTTLMVALRQYTARSGVLDSVDDVVDGRARAGIHPVRPWPIWEPSAPSEAT
jgi:hypothetical protein